MEIVSWLAPMVALPSTALLMLPYYGRYRECQRRANGLSDKTSSAYRQAHQCECRFRNGLMALLIALVLFATASLLVQIYALMPEADAILVHGLTVSGFLALIYAASQWLKDIYQTLLRDEMNLEDEDWDLPPST